MRFTKSPLVAENLRAIGKHSLLFLQAEELGLPIPLTRGIRA